MKIFRFGLINNIVADGVNGIFMDEVNAQRRKSKSKIPAYFIAR